MKSLKICISSVLILMLSACWSSRELDELAIVMGIGIDKNGDKINCCTQVIVPQNVGAGEDGGKSTGEPYTNFETEDIELSSAISKISNITGKSIFMSHNLVAVFDEDAAKDGIYKYLDYLIRDNQLRPGVCLLVTDVSAEKLLDADTPLFEIPSINLSKISLELQKNFTGQNITVLKFIDNMMSKQKGSMVPLATLENGKIKVKGAAVFSEDKMVYSIDEKDVKGVLWILGDISSGDVVLNINNNALSLRIVKIKTKIEPVIEENGEIYFKADIKSNFHLVRDDANVIKTTGMDTVLTKLNDYVCNDALSSLSKMKDIGADVYGFGDMIYRKNPAVWRAVESSWGERFKRIRVEVSADCNIIDTGSVVGSVRNNKPDTE